MKQKLLEMVQVTVFLHTDEFIFVWSFKYAYGRQNRSSGAKTGLLRRAGAKTQYPGDTCQLLLREPAWSVYMLTKKYYFYLYNLVEKIILRKPCNISRYFLVFKNKHRLLLYGFSNAAYIFFIFQLCIFCTFGFWIIQFLDFTISHFLPF